MNRVCKQTDDSDTSSWTLIGSGIMLLKSCNSKASTATLGNGGNSNVRKFEVL
jgi:hypothetical protein